MTTVLISGAGIAGPTLAYWLLQCGFQPTIVERAPALRTGGYVIDFWGLGYDVAEKMKLLPELRKRGYRAEELRLVDRHGKRVGGFTTDIFQSNLNNRFFSILRSDLAAVVYEAIADKVEVIFGDSIEQLQTDNDQVEVSFTNGIRRTFDLIVGADGLHSIVRRIEFGPHKQFEKLLGYSVAAFSAKDYQPRDDGAYVCYSPPGKQIARFALRDNQTVFFLIFRDFEKQTNGQDQSSNRSKLDAVLNDSGWECKQILGAMHSATDLYFDSVSQIHMPSWSKGRVVLVGDAAFCPSLLAGQGAALAMAGSYILAGELKRAAGDHAAAFKSYEDRLRSFICKKQKAAEKFGSWFAPDTELAIFIRNQITKLFAVPIISHKFVSDAVADKLTLPDF